MIESKFQTIVEIPKFNWKTGYNKKNILMGSCFTENVGGKMAELKYDVDINPFGILYNPVSVANGLKILMEKKEFSYSDLIQQNGIWHSFSHHGKFSSHKKNDVIKMINKRIHFSFNFLKNADFIFVTFGTAWVYKFRPTGQTVSNCHKIPATQFERIRLSVDDIVQEYKNLLDKIRDFNPKLKTIFTVSPVRHWKDGAIENQRSKSTLSLAIEQIIKENSERCAYFPSYEILMDELRDYRFYTEDMIHVSDAAIKHIWEKFEKALIDDESCKISAEIKNLVSAINHRPLFKYTNEHLIFLKKLVKKTVSLLQKYPFVNLDLEIDNLNTQIKEIENKI